MSLDGQSLCTSDVRLYNKVIWTDIMKSTKVVLRTLVTQIYTSEQ